MVEDGRVDVCYHCETPIVFDPNLVKLQDGITIDYGWRHQLEGKPRLCAKEEPRACLGYSDTVAYPQGE